MTNDDLGKTSAWLYRLGDGLSDACTDAQAAVNGKINYLGFDFSFLYPNITVRESLNAENPRHRYDLASKYLYDNLRLYRPEVLGYKLVFNDFCFLKLLYHYSFQSEFLDRLITSDDFFKTLSHAIPSSPQSNGDPMTSAGYADALGAVIDEAQIVEPRLQRFRRRLTDKLIIGTGDIFDKDLIRRSWSDRESYNAAYSIIDNYRQDVPKDTDPTDAEFLKKIDTLTLISNKHLCDNAPERYRYLGWTKGRGFYGSEATRYYRLVLAPFYRLVTLRETPDADNLVRSANISLEDRRDQARLYHRRAFSLYNSGGSELSPVYIDAISIIRDDYLKHLRGDTASMQVERRRKLAESLSGSAKEARLALSEAVESHKNSLSTLSALASDFADDELLSRYELHDSPRMKRIFRDLKLGL